MKVTRTNIQIFDAYQYSGNIKELCSFMEDSRSSPRIDGGVLKIKACEIEVNDWIVLDLDGSYFGLYTDDNFKNTFDEEEGQILYKAVTAERYSAIVHAHRYVRHYQIGEIVEATPGTLGLFCFKTREKAGEWFRYTEQSRYRIIKVQAIGKVLPAPESIAYVDKIKLQKKNLDEFYSRVATAVTSPLSGSVTVQKLKVLS